MRHSCRFCKFVFLGLALVALSSASPSVASTITVSSLADSGGGSLRAAIATASPGDTIVFGVTGTINLSSVLVISTNLTVSGPGAASLAISGGNASDVFQIGNSYTVAISGVTIENGKSGYYDCGGGILNYGTLTVTNSTFSGNSGSPIYSGGGGICNFLTLTVTNSTFSDNYAYAGGGIFNWSGTATVTNSTFSGNSGSYAGGGIFNNYGTVTVTKSTFSGNSAGLGGGILNYGTLTVTNSTFSANSAYDGGGIYNQSGTATVTNSTFSGNSGSYAGGGIFNYDGTLAIKSTLLANSPSGGNAVNGYGTIVSGGYNLSDDGCCASFFTQTGDLNNTPAGLDPSGLKDNGGPTQTIALLPTSPAVDAIPVSDCTDVAGNPVTTDQRGVVRPQGPACDIGAFELAAYAAQVQHPINPDGSSVFSVKRGVVPVKFTLTLDGTPTCNLPAATISLTRTAGTTTGSVDESVYLSPSDSGSNFRIDTTNCQYVYNLGTSSLGAGTYRVNISIGVSVVGSGIFGLQ